MPADIADKSRCGSRLREFAEYLWQFAWFPCFAERRSSPATGATRRICATPCCWHSPPDQGNGACDRVDVAEWHFAADSATGDVTRQFEALPQL